MDSNWHEIGSARWSQLHVPTAGKSGFVPRRGGESGILFSNVLDGGSAAANRVLETGSGVAAGDYDKDGMADLFFCSLAGQCKLYKNQGGLTFLEVTREARINCEGSICRGAVFADIDADDDLDLLISTTGKGVLCFANDGSGHFQEMTRVAGTGSPFASMTMTLADVDGNGSLDLYVTNYRTNDVRDAGRVELQSINGRTVVPPALQNRFILVEGQVQEYGDPDLLYLNDGKGRFKPVSWVTGSFRNENDKPLERAPFDWGLTAAFRDLNGDGFPDLYVCNDYWTPDRIWMNDGKGQFKALSTAAIRHTSASSMGVDFADIDRDGSLDFFVVDMLARARKRRLRQTPAYTGPPVSPGEILDRPQLNRNTLFHNRGDGTFEEIAEFSGLPASDWAWQPIFLDVDLDGYSDVLVASGHSHDVQDRDADEEALRSRPNWPKGSGMVMVNGTLTPFQKAFTAERMRQLRLYPDYHGFILGFRNSGKLTFEERTGAWGLTSPGIHHGVALDDLDNDGDLDVVVNTLNAEAELWINQTAAPRVAVELRGIPPNTDAIGAKVTLRNGAVSAQTEEMTAGGKYLSSSQSRLVFAPGLNSNDMTIDVVWRSGAKTRVERVQPNRLYQIKESPSQ